MIEIGTILVSDRPFPFVVISEPDPADGGIVIVPILKFIDPINEDICLLRPQEIDSVVTELAHVCYKRATKGNLCAIEKAIKDGILRVRFKLTNDVVRKIIQGARRAMRPEFVRLLRSSDDF